MTDYGIDLAGIEDMDPTGREVTGRLVLAESLARRYQTVKGQLIGFPEDGYDVRQLLSAKATRDTLEQAKVDILEEAKRDERVFFASMLIWEYSGTLLKWEMEIIDSEGPFSLTFAATSDSVSLLSVSQV